MITIVHGSDTAASRKYFLTEKQRYADSLLLDADQVDLTELAQICEGGGLFGETKYLFIEQFLTKRKKSGDYKQILSYLEAHAHEHTIYFWEAKDLDIGTLKALKQPIIRAFKLPQTLFQLLDAFAPNNQKKVIQLFHETIANTETEMVFFMLVRQVRILLALASSDNEPIDEVKRIAPWQRTKLEKQTSQFTPEHLQRLYAHLYKIEVGQKTGTLAVPLTTAIDIFLLEV